MSLDEAWAAAKAAAGVEAKLTLHERETTVEAFAKLNMTSLGFGYGPTPVEALNALTKHLKDDTHEQTTQSTVDTEAG